MNTFCEDFIPFPHFLHLNPLSFPADTLKSDNDFKSFPIIFNNFHPCFKYFCFIFDFNGKLILKKYFDFMKTFMVIKIKY